jgi:HEAT repeat protein
MMLWWKYQQLRSSSLNARLATIAELAASKDADSVGPLLFALKDRDKEVRSAAALALGQFQDKKALEPLMKLLRDPTPLARATAAEALAQLQDPGAIPPLINLLRDADPTVRGRASRSLEQLGWQPENDAERTLHIVATGNLNRVAELGSDGVELLADMMRNGPPEKQLSAVKALGEIEDPRVPKLMLEALRKNNVLVRLAALEFMERLADPSTYEVVERLLKDKASNIRSAAVSAAVSCGGSRAVPTLMGMLMDVSWEVRREVIKALGRLGDATAIDGLVRTLQDRDHDVRESAAVALGGIGDPRAIRPLVLALLDIESFVRNAAHNSLAEIDPHWEKTDAARSALPQIQAARKHREYWISHSAAQLLAQIQSDVPAKTDVPAGAVTIPVAPPPEIISRAMPINPAAAFDILAELLGDRDRDLRLAAAEAFSQLREKRATALLATAIHDDDAFVRQAAEQALIALN